MPEVIRIPTALEQGQSQAAEGLLPLFYDELRRPAAWRLANEKAGRLGYLRLAGQRELHCNGRRYFLGAVAEAMRRILVENTRRRKHLKRGGEVWQRTIE